jgi:hypothetical protein
LGALLPTSVADPFTNASPPAAAAAAVATTSHGK